MAETDRERLRKLAARPRLSEDEFYDCFYSRSEVPRDIPIRLRRLWADELGDEWYGVEPGDKPEEILWWLDLADLYRAAAEEFRINIRKADWRAIDGSFDSLVRYLAERLWHASRS